MIMNNILIHCERRHSKVGICITQFFQGKDHTIEHVLCSGLYDPEFCDLEFHFSVDGRRLPVSSKLQLLYKFARAVLKY